MAKARPKSADIYAAGYAIPLYDICTSVRHWRFGEEVFSLPWDAVYLRAVEWIPFQVARIADVRRAAHG